ncbi:MAG: hypothetical protein R2867_04320 [Caldilineaceae bacterium]
MHAALGDADANLIEAAGESINPNGEREEVRKIGIQHTGFYKQTFELNDNQDVIPVVVNDWVVLRVKDEYKNKVDGAVGYATGKAYDPSVTYNSDFLNANNKTREDAFYCSQLVWRAYFEQGLDLDYNRGIAPALLPVLLEIPIFAAQQQQVLPDDIYSSISNLDGVTDIVQSKPDVSNFDRTKYVVWVLPKYASKISWVEVWAMTPLLNL